MITKIYVYLYNFIAKLGKLYMNTLSNDFMHLIIFVLSSIHNLTDLESQRQFLNFTY